MTTMTMASNGTPSAPSIAHAATDTAAAANNR